MRERTREYEPMCETSEPGERLISLDEEQLTALDIGRRIMEIFGYQQIANIVFRLKINSREINAVVNGETMPSASMLLCIRKATGVSIDWILTGEGSRFTNPTAFPSLSLQVVSPNGFSLLRAQNRP